MNGLPSPSTQCPSISTSASSTSSTATSSPEPTTSPNDISRTRSSVTMLSRVLTAGVGQMTLSALCSEENVADAPISTPATERIAAARDVGVPRVRDDRLQRAGGVHAHDTADLGEEPPLHGIGAEEDARHRDHDDERRRKRKRREERDRRREHQAVILRPLRDRIDDPGKPAETRRAARGDGRGLRGGDVLVHRRGA